MDCENIVHRPVRGHRSACDNAATDGRIAAVLEPLNRRLHFADRNRARRIDAPTDHIPRLLNPKTFRCVVRLLGPEFVNQFDAAAFDEVTLFAAILANRDEHGPT